MVSLSVSRRSTMLPHGLSPRSIRFSRYAPPSARRRAARRYNAIPRAARGRLSASPHLLHIEGARTAGRARRRAGSAGGAPAPPAHEKSGGPEAPAARESAVHRSAAPCSPTGLPRSTIGARRLSFRVRNGSGRAPPAMAADRWAALRPPRGGYVSPGAGPACPGGRTARRWTSDPTSDPTGSIRAAPVPSETAPAAI